MVFSLSRAHALLHDVLLTARYSTPISGLLLSFEFLLTLLIIQRVPYTEIDWTAYMQEVNGVLGGERNYMNLKGDTGPLVYPAGFVWIYSALQRLTDGKVGIAQLWFLALYLANLALVLAIYRKLPNFPSLMLALLVLSKRIHSIFVLRLFNDPVAMVFAYLAVYCLVTSKAKWSGLAASMGIAVKMNVLLFLPGLLYVWWRMGGICLVLAQLAVVVIVQLLVAVPFLVQFPGEYLARAFELTRQFAFQWTVNWRFLGEETFRSSQWARALLIAHVALLCVFAALVWPRLARQNVVQIVKSGLMRGQRRVGADEVMTVVFTSNLIGVVCARSLHYQFYSWYFHTLPFLLYKTRLHYALQAALWLTIEVCWNVYPR
ncbi:dolichyl-P-Man:Man(5)GlcNAc(2)-PP-dolichol alpha-1,3-mannosyltransferase [Linderina pennispora]|nr:dolichyl-P-Man:Man(5)GlcNAc(2)-PP-dolichol alpha-1,3-mannosyltransferase [Linderina pennispora]